MSAEADAERRRSAARAREPISAATGSVIAVVRPTPASPPLPLPDSRRPPPRRPARVPYSLPLPCPRSPKSQPFHSNPLLYSAISPSMPSPLPASSSHHSSPTHAALDAAAAPSASAAWHDELESSVCSAASRRKPTSSTHLGR